MRLGNIKYFKYIASCNGKQQNTNNHPQFVTYLVLSILMCCCCFNIPGIISGILTFLGNDAYKHGNMTEAEAKFVLARKVLIAGLIIGIIIQVIAWVGGFSSMMLDAIKNK